MESYFFSGCVRVVPFHGLGGHGHGVHVHQGVRGCGRADLLHAHGGGCVHVRAHGCVNVHVHGYV